MYDLAKGALQQTIEIIRHYIQIFRPSAVMAASNWENALPAAIASLESGVPFFYEVRGFWEISQIAKRPEWEFSNEFKQALKGESAIAKSASKVFTLNRFMKAELVRRGVSADVIDLIPNGFSGWPQSCKFPVTRIEHGIKSRFVVGYIGSFNEYEGLELLIEALAVVRERGIDAALLLVGSGHAAGLIAGGCKMTLTYRKLAERLGISEYLFMPGRVSNDLAPAYYDLLDVVVIPRKPLSVCELVSPMKPLEAASHNKWVLMSDVAPLLDLANLCIKFRYFRKGSVISMADELQALAELPMNEHTYNKELSRLTWDKNVGSLLKSLQWVDDCTALAIG